MSAADHLVQRPSRLNPKVSSPLQTIATVTRRATRSQDVRGSLRIRELLQEEGFVHRQPDLQVSLPRHLRHPHRLLGPLHDGPNFRGTAHSGTVRVVVTQQKLVKSRVQFNSLFSGPKVIFDFCYKHMLSTSFTAWNSSRQIQKWPEKRREKRPQNSQSIELPPCGAGETTFSCL